MNPGGLLHSDIPGSKLICNSPRLFAAYHVFLRLLVPRHSPCALCSLTKLRLFSIVVLDFSNIPDMISHIVSRFRSIHSLFNFQGTTSIIR